MFSLKPGTTAIIIGARTAAGRANIGKSVELFALINPGERCLNPVNGVMTELAADAPRALWLVTGDVSTGRKILQAATGTLKRVSLELGGKSPVIVCRDADAAFISSQVLPFYDLKGVRVLLVDDSIVRGTTSREIVQMARDAGAKKVYFASAAPAVRFPNVYGIDMPTRAELLATGRDDAAIAREIGADAVIYQDLDALKAAVHAARGELSEFETSCFDGVYVTGDIDEAFLAKIEAAREHSLSQRKGAEGEGMVDLNLNVAEQNLM